MEHYINLQMAATICSGVLCAKLIWFLAMSMLSLLTSNTRRGLPAARSAYAERGNK